MDQLGNHPQSRITYADNNLNEKNMDQSLVYDGNQVYHSQQHNHDLTSSNTYNFGSAPVAENIVQIHSSDVHNVYISESQAGMHTVENTYQDNVLISTTAVDESGNVQASNMYEQTILESTETIPMTQDNIQSVESLSHVSQEKKEEAAAKDNQNTYTLHEQTENLYVREVTQSSQPETAEQDFQVAQTSQSGTSQEQHVQGEVIQTEVTEVPADDPEAVSYEETPNQGNYVVEEPDTEAAIYETEFAANNPPDEDNVEVIPLPPELAEVKGQVQEVSIEEVSEDGSEVKQDILKEETYEHHEPMDIHHENISDDGDMNNELNEQTGEMEMRKVQKDGVEENVVLEEKQDISSKEQQIASGSTGFETDEFSAIDDVPPEGSLDLTEEPTPQEEVLTINEEYVESEEVDDPTNLEEGRSESKLSIASTTSSTTGQKKRGRKSTNDIPLHVLGHNLDRPLDTMLNGRSSKPRLGVKVPPRNLTSQIVSKEEIENAIIERSKKKQDDLGGKMFANKLTRRLAKKIAPAIIDLDADEEPTTESDPTDTTDTTTGNKGTELEADTSPAKPESSASTVVSTAAVESKVEPKTTKSSTLNIDVKEINDNSDLLAILEGEGEDMPVLPKEIEDTTPTDESNIKNLEREIALQQLSDLPYLSPKQRTYRGRMCKESKAPMLSPEVAKTTASTSRGTNTPTSIASNKENSKSATTIVAPLSPKKDVIKVPIEVEPQIKVNMALKTYSRKRKSSDNVELYPEAKRSVTEFVTEVRGKNENPTIPTDVYVTKSSRVIKRKVIWDPDEIPNRSPKHGLKSDITPTSTPKVTPVKSVKPENTEKTPDTKLVTEKKIEVPKVKPDKKEERDKPIAKKVETPQKKAVEVTPKKVESPVKKTPEPTKKSDFAHKNVESSSRQSKTPQSDKKTAVSPASKAGMKYKKSRSEVDKLLGDEGAIKMLYELKNTEETENRRKKKAIVNVEKTYKDLAKKATEIKSELVNTSSNESPKILRKKETTPSPSATPLKPPAPLAAAAISRQKSKDSTRSTPPASPSYTFPNSETYLIRRRSSSSFSSGGEDPLDSDERPIRPKTKRSKRHAEGPKEPKKDPLAIESDKEKSDILESESERVDTKKYGKADGKFGTYESFTVKKTGKQVVVDLNYGGGEAYLTFKTLVELSNVLSKLALERDCNVVLLTSSSNSFCLGLDYRFLLSDNETERKKKAKEVAWEVSNFLKCLLYFPKILVAGIQGECVGLGVTMLPLFDFVVASDSSSFRTPYSSLGCVAEAGFLLTSPHLPNHGLAAELLYTSQKLTADDAFRRGLISKLCWPEKYQDSLKNLVTSVAKGSRQSLESTKKQLKSSLQGRTSAAIESMEKQLIAHWTSYECQKNFAKLDSEGN